MTHTALRSAFFAMAVVFCMASASGAERIESRFFPNPELQLESRWLVPNPQVSTDPLMANTMVAQAPFTELRLSIPPTYVGKAVRIYLVFPPSAQGIVSGRGLEAEWRSQGVFLSGKARPGDRVLFFEGTPSSSLLKDFVAYTFTIDARETMGPIRFETVYEIEPR